MCLNRQKASMVVVKVIVRPVSSALEQVPSYVHRCLEKRLPRHGTRWLSTAIGLTDRLPPR